MNLTELVHVAGETSEAKGFHDVGATFGDRIALAHSELSEALEAFRDLGHTDLIYEDSIAVPDKPDGVPAELADVLIRIADLCWVEDIDLEKAVRRKVAYNRYREHLHGGKAL